MSPHTSHVHTSFSRNSSGFDSNSAQSFIDEGRATAAAKTQSARPTLSMGSSGEFVRAVQTTLNAWYPNLLWLAEDGIFGSKTVDWSNTCSASPAWRSTASSVERSGLRSVQVATLRPSEIGECQR